MSKKFLKLSQSFWEKDDIQKLSSSTLIFLIDLLFISYSFSHRPFYQTSKQLYQKCNLKNRMNFSRKKKDLEKLDIKIQRVMKNYHFDLADFFDKYYSV